MAFGYIAQDLRRGDRVFHVLSLPRVDDMGQLSVDGRSITPGTVFTLASDPVNPEDLAIGRRIAAARAARGLSLQQVADKLDVSKATIGHWETGARAIKHGDLARLCKLLAVSADLVLFGERQWPFKSIPLERVACLDRSALDLLAGAMALAAAQLGIDLRPQQLGGANTEQPQRNPEGRKSA